MTWLALYSSAAGIAFLYMMTSLMRSLRDGLSLHPHSVQHWNLFAAVACVLGVGLAVAWPVLVVGFVIVKVYVAIQPKPVMARRGAEARSACRPRHHRRCRGDAGTPSRPPSSCRRSRRRP